MKLVVLLLCALVFTVSAKSYYDKILQEIKPRIGEENIKKIVKGIVNRLCYGVPSMGIPKLEPFQQVQPVDVKLNHSMAELNGQVSKILVKGLSGLELVDVSLNPSTKFSFTITIPKVKASGEFKVKGSLAGLFPVNGDGSFDITVSGIKFTASGRLATIDKMLQLADLKAEPSINKLEAKIVNLVPNAEVNDLINDVLNQIGPQLLQDMWFDVGGDILYQIEQLSRSLMTDIDVLEIIKILMSGKDVFHPDDPAPDCPPVVIP